MTAKKKETELTPGENLVKEILAQMVDVGVCPDAKEDALLAVASQLVDRMDELDKVVSREGLMLASSTGPRVHAAAVEHRQLAVSLPKVLAGIVIPASMSGQGKNPVKQRAAQARWDRREQQRSAQAERAGLS